VTIADQHTWTSVDEYFDAVPLADLGEQLGFTVCYSKVYRYSPQPLTGWSTSAAPEPSDGSRPWPPR
jgi:hypothetical protein